MAYQVLARKWRPKNFKEMIGQEHVLRALINALEKERLHHAYLFTGTRGIGKTSVARILAKCLNCETGITATPCNECQTCCEINEGRFIDLIEVDAASRTKVEDTRELLDNVQYAPTNGRFKIYLIDEVHMLSGHSFNALLKTLEEPPPHVKFLLATTDPQKLPITVLSRCLQFHLKALSIDRIQQHLTHVLQQEKVGFEEEALTQLGRAANGSMRDALSLLDQAIAFGDNQVNVSDVNAMLGTIEKTYIHELLSALTQQNSEQLFDVVNRVAEITPDFSNVLDELLCALQQIAIAQAMPSKSSEFNAGTLSAEQVQLYYQIALTGKRDLPYAPDPRTGFEMIMLRMLAFNLDQTQVQITEPRPVAKTASQPQQTQVKTQTQQPQAQAKPKAAPSNDWQETVAQLNLSGMAQALATHCALKSLGDNHLQLSIAPKHSAMLNDKLQTRLNDALNVHHGKTITLKISIEEPDTHTPAEQQTQAKTAKASAADDAIKKDPNVQSLIETFGAQIQETKSIN